MAGSGRLPHGVTRAAGFTVVELAVVCSMIAILSAMAIPVAKYSLKRQNEMELRYDLRLLRDAIPRNHGLQSRNRGRVPEKIPIGIQRKMP